MGLLSRLFGTGRRGGGPAPVPGPFPIADDLDGDAFECSSCGRTDLMPAGQWDPPICEECDAAINFDAIEEFERLDETEA